ncbi:glycoside hydrolase family 88 protein [Sphingobium yanoikuyae]|uniref:Glycoside hydrolase family 88 protein n=1 Tax=Sphingobium yanoikuyae TaxID=13690 RepID=A0A9X7YGE3_SPHYA|nr:glycoside hydrolase family 88 protein [Sphingobium yanoikuyae]
MKAPLLTAAYVTHDGVEQADRALDRAVATQRSDGSLAYSDAVHAPGGHIRSFTPLPSLSASLGYPLLLSLARQENAALRAGADRLAQGLLATRRTKDGGICARAEAPELWVDFTYLICPFLALYGQQTGDRQALDEAFRQFAIHVDHLFDRRKGLARHAWCERPDHYPQSTFWTRGNGWLICAAVDLLDVAPDHPGANLVRQIGGDALQSMATYQDASGYFTHILDDPTSNLEASGTLMYAYAVARAVRQGVVPGDQLASAHRAFAVVAGGVEPSGKVPGVAVPPGGPGVPFDWAPFGQGFYALAAHALDQAGGQAA